MISLYFTGSGSVSAKLKEKLGEVEVVKVVVAWMKESDKLKELRVGKRLTVKAKRLAEVE